MPQTYCRNWKKTSQMKFCQNKRNSLYLTANTVIKSPGGIVVNETIPNP